MARPTITGLTVCVNYSDFLINSVGIWREGLKNLIVVTDFQDQNTFDLGNAFGCDVYRTDVFYRDKAHFNKGRAIAQAFDHFLPKISQDQWFLFFDADIIPPENWLDIIDDVGIIPGNLYGVPRIKESGHPIRDGELAGYFHLAHVQDKNMQVKPIVDTQWNNAGIYDSRFSQRWPKEKQKYLPFQVLHQGEPGQNWCGRGNSQSMKELLQNRAKNRGRYDHEKIEEST